MCPADPRAVDRLLFENPMPLLQTPCFREIPDILWKSGSLWGPAAVCLSFGSMVVTFEPPVIHSLHSRDHRKFSMK